MLNKIKNLLAKKHTLKYNVYYLDVMHMKIDICSGEFETKATNGQDAIEEMRKLNSVVNAVNKLCSGPNRPRLIWYSIV